MKRWLQLLSYSNRRVLHSTIRPSFDESIDSNLLFDACGSFLHLFLDDAWVHLNILEVSFYFSMKQRASVWWLFALKGSIYWLRSKSRGISLTRRPQRKEEDSLWIFYSISCGYRVWLNLFSETESVEELVSLMESNYYYYVSFLLFFFFSLLVRLFPNENENISNRRNALLVYLSIASTHTGILMRLKLQVYATFTIMPTSAIQISTLLFGELLQA